MIEINASSRIAGKLSRHDATSNLTNRVGVGPDRDDG
jgi:hypothetical protein